MNLSHLTKGSRPYLTYKRNIIAASLLTLTMLTGCSGGSDSTTLTITSSTPADNATDVARTVAPQLTFSTSLNSATATSTNVTLTSTAGPVTATLTVTGTQLTVTPSKPLALLTTYSLQVGTGLSGIDGTRLASAQTRTFRTADGTWRAADVIETDGGAATTPQIAFDANGNAMAVWRQVNGGIQNIYANRYEAGSGWGITTALLETGSGNAASYPQIAVDANGNAIAVWRQDNGGIENIYANRYEAGSGWGITAQLLQTDGGAAYAPRIAFDANGNAIAVWSQDDGTTDSIYARRYEAGSGWGITAQLLETGSGAAYDPQIAFDASGNAMAVWHQNDGTTNSIYARRYEAGSGWGITAQLLETGSGNAISPQIAVDASGNAMAVWSQDDGGIQNIYANRYTAGSVWGTAQLLETGSGDAIVPQIAFDASGNAMAVWYQVDGGIQNIYANRYTAGSVWGTAQLLETGSGNALEPRMAIDAGGNVMAVWHQNDGTTNSIYAARLD